MDKIILILMCFFLFSCGGDGNGHHSPPTPPIPIPEPTPEPTPIPEPIPEPIDCCPIQEHTLRCGDCTEQKPCLTDHPDVSIYCSTIYSNPMWIIKISWGKVYVDLVPFDTNCCPVEKTGILPSQCTTTKQCNTLYANQPTEWHLFCDDYGTWIIYSDRLHQNFRIEKGVI